MTGNNKTTDQLFIVTSALITTLGLLVIFWCIFIPPIAQPTFAPAKPPGTKPVEMREPVKAEAWDYESQFDQEVRESVKKSRKPPKEPVPEIHFDVVPPQFHPEDVVNERKENRATE